MNKKALVNEILDLWKSLGGVHYDGRIWCLYWCIGAGTENGKYKGLSGV